ncbi:isoquinoline 1-oxidoreductase alpha subunit [Wenyingzhuangia heitensis]|uniref:Isoquinoline 1-oxidoreductase alpha subunit n=1 Tax=Wenyingzhuangia heitensis TaxID=1487859 RepID=A0ABX0U585_9FLAO|nr:(2Fe-2S)-binding protein [Wenyingzhuangia heitensis]NIJ44023.1 isoquinoline 1-oxidoreductase alpha subunit [Wenyingzhuangia heitensis]
MQFKLTVNNKVYKVDVDQDTPLLWVLRDHLHLVGTKFGCGIGQCGACSVHLNGTVIRSCLFPVIAVGDSKITTIEGLSDQNNHPVQIAWRDIDVPQCGYCQAGQIMAASSFLAENKNPTKNEIKDAMHGNICRCATYKRIEKAVEKAVEITQKTK